VFRLAFNRGRIEEKFFVEKRGVKMKMKGECMKASFVVVMLLSLCATGAFAAVSYDSVTDWVKGDPSNPLEMYRTPNWTFGFMDVPGGAFNEFSSHSALAFGDVWWDGSEPWIAKATNWSGFIPDGMVGMHPGPRVADGGLGIDQCAVSRFTTPVAGTYDISGVFQGVSAGTKDVYVQKNGVTLFSHLSLVGTVPSPFTLPGVTLASGDQVDFIIMGTTSYSASATMLCATLTKQFTPSATSWDATTDYFPKTLPPIQTVNSFGQWSLGYLPVNAGVPGTFVTHTRKLTRADGFDEFDNGTTGDAGYSVLYNFNYNQIWWYKPRPNWSVVPLLTGYPCIRFTAPQNGKYTVSCSFSGVPGGAYQPGGDPNSHATTKAHIDTIAGVRTSLFTADVNGFDGTGLVDVANPANAAVSSTSPAPYVNANITGVNLAQGNTIEFYVDPRGDSAFDGTYMTPSVVRTGAYVPTCAEGGIYGPMDFNHDCSVNFKDFASFAAVWLNCTDQRPPCNYVP
jgi:hypothetical protein